MSNADEERAHAPNPNDTWASFVEAARKGRVMSWTSSQGRIKEIAVPHPLGWAIPVFDFGNPLGLGIDFGEMHDRGLDLLNERRLRLPFGEFALLWEGGADEPAIGESPLSQEIWHAVPHEGATVLVEHWRDRWLPSRWSPWVHTPLAAAIWPEEGRYGSAATTLPGEDTYEPPARAEDVLQDDALARDCASNFLGFIAVLSHRGASADEAPPTDVTRAVNAGRERAGLRPRGRASNPAPTR